MGTRMLLFPGEEHLHRAPSWGGMHDPDVGTPTWMSSYSPSSGGNTWSKRLAATNPNPNPHSNSNSTPNDSESWEVRAFAEDASTSGQWPPRSYSCSFCQREFRTAQALGGHMNVHRRERAQANQLAQLRSSEAPSHHHHNTSNVTPAASLPPDHHAHHHHWLTRETQAVDHSHYGTTSSSSSGYEGHHRHAYEESSYPGTSSYGAPEAPFRNYSSPYEGSAWRSSYETSSRDAGLDLELRLGQRYD